MFPDEWYSMITSTQMYVKIKANWQEQFLRTRGETLSGPAA